MPSFDHDQALERLRLAFQEIIAETPIGGCSLAVYQDGRQLLSLHAGAASPGREWEASTPCLIWSASKGVAAACTLHALREKGISLEARVSEFWPEFGTQGKESVTLAELLSHRAGLAAIEPKGLGLSITDHEAVCAALATQPPNWNLKEDDSNGKFAMHGYGARTFGFLLDEIIRRITGETLSSYWKRVFQEPLGLDLWFGLPESYAESLVESAATVIAPKTPPSPGHFSEAFTDPNSLTRRALSEPGGFLTPSVMNTEAMRRASIPSLGAIATADSLARFYALLAGDGEGFFQPETLASMQATLTKGPDRVLIDKTSFSAGFMTNDYGVYGLGKNSFGHPGAGGSLGFSDPKLGLGFAFIPSAMHPGALPGARTQKLVKALYGS
ncbi:MAG: serine hydrolase domain-containing protein [Verrucomicrobiota bacterium]